MKTNPFQLIISLVLTLTIVLPFSCKKSNPISPDIPVISEGSLTLLASYPLLVTEPSGLTFGPEKKTLLTVSDNSNLVYELALTGEIIRSLNYQGSDLEGVTYNPFNNTIAITEERKRNVVIMDYTSGEIIGDYHIEIPSGSENSGLEGIAFDNNSRVYYLLNEINPGEMILWTPEEGIIAENNLTFAEDYSGIYIESGILWMVSDLSQMLFACNYKGEPITKYQLNRSKYEGVVFESSSETVYLVNDATAELAHYQINKN